jgi:hypothetical protein
MQDAVRNAGGPEGAECGVLVPNDLPLPIPKARRDLRVSEGWQRIELQDDPRTVHGTRLGTGDRDRRWIQAREGSQQYERKNCVTNSSSKRARVPHRHLLL